MFRSEIDSKVETSEQRRIRLETRAKQLRDQRLQKRGEFVKEQKLKQFRNSCDELRLNQGQDLLMDCDRVHHRQLAEKELQQQLEEQQKQEWLKTWSEDLNAKFVLEQKEQEQRKQLDMFAQQDLKNQIKEHQTLEENRQAQKQKDKLARVRSLTLKICFQTNKNVFKVANLRQSEEDSGTIREKDVTSLREKHQEQYQQYLEFQKAKQNKINAEKKADMEWVQSIVAREKQEDMAKNAKSTELQDDIKSYLTYLQQLKQEEQQKERELDVLRERAFNEIVHKQKTQEDKQEAARQQLLRHVIEERNNQLVVKQSEQENYQKANENFFNEMIKGIKLDDLKEQKECEEKLKYNRQTQEFLRFAFFLIKKDLDLKQ
ncbi:Protein kinase domain containing protein [Reticulomyxa filosa]|uniref:Protein kinase domain containing protein n=1 Tax=Reticulomyxa filosa TaxID=46433 RepID=X6NXE4_RETFI|nr:Protein kinase domain containing protein [Reticulomyxa filosa]|eukprot:ETO30558.1 Protein kinase domain containing protein [Reticulomyxa filosa]